MWPARCRCSTAPSAPSSAATPSSCATSRGCARTARRRSPRSTASRASQRSQWNYRTHSLLDVVNGALPSQDDVVLLDEHYRSLPQIIEFSNRRFYGRRLRVMTRRPDTIGARSVELRKVNGKRNKHGYNVEEAEAILKEIKKIAKARGQEAAQRALQHRRALALPRSGELL